MGLRSTLVALIDLMAAVPSIIYGLWGFFLLQPHAIHVARWLAQYAGWVPFFHVDTDPGSATWAQTVFTEFVSAVVSVMLPNCSSEKLLSGVPEMTTGDLPLTVEPGENAPLSIAAAAVTTFIVEPGP